MAIPTHHTNQFHPVNPINPVQSNDDETLRAPDSFCRLISAVIMRPIFASSFILLITLVTLITLITGAGVRAVHAQATSPSEARSQRLLVRALTHLQTGNADQAIDALVVAHGLRPDDAAILSTLAEAHRLNGDLPAALYYAESALDAAPMSEDVILGLAGVLIAAGDTGSAADLLDEHARSNELNAGFAARSVRLLNLGGSADRASLFGMMATDMLGYQPDVLSAMAELPAVHRESVVDHLVGILSDGRLPAYDSIMMAEWIRDHGSDDARGAAAAGVDDGSETSGLIASVLGESPRRIRPGGDDASTAPLQPLNEPAEASAAADFWLARIEDDPRQVSAWERASERLLAAGRAEEAVVTAEEATLLFPGNPRLRSLLGMAMLDAGDPDLALPYLTIEESAGALALAQVLLEREDDALQTLSRFMLSESTAEQVAYAAIAYAMMGDVPQEIETLLTESAALLPDHVVTREAIGWIHYAAGHNDAATEAFEDVTGMGGHLSRFCAPLIELYERANRMGEASELRSCW